MKTVTNTEEIARIFEIFLPDEGEAYPTGRLIKDASSALDPQEWAENGEISGVPTKVYYLFSEDEVKSEDASDYPWDAAHVSKLEIAEIDGLEKFSIAVGPKQNKELKLPMTLNIYPALLALFSF